MLTGDEPLGQLSAVTGAHVGLERDPDSVYLVALRPERDEDGWRREQRWA